MRALSISKPTAFGHMDLLWLTVQDQRGPDEDGVLRGWTDQDISDAAEWDGEPSEFVQAAHEAGFLDRGDDGTYAVHDYIPWMPLHVKERVRKRQAYQLTEKRNNFREVSGKSPGRLAELPQKVGGTSPPHVHVHEHVHKDPPAPPGGLNGIADRITATWGITDETRLKRLTVKFEALGTPEEIGRRRARLKALWGDKGDTPESLLKHWGKFGQETLTPIPGQPSRAEQAAMEAEWAEQRARVERERAAKR